MPFSFLRQRPSRFAVPRRDRTLRRYRPQLERLEDLTLPATLTWTGGGDGTSWNDANNWDDPTSPTGHDVPNGGDDAVIGSGFSVVAGAAFNHPSVARSLSVGSGTTLSILSNQQLGVPNIALDGLITMAGQPSAQATFDLPGPSAQITGSGEVRLGSFSQMRLSGAVTFGSGITVGGGGTVTLSGTLTNNGTIHGSTELQGVSSGATFVNAGIVTTTQAGETLRVNAVWTNNGTVEADAGTILLVFSSAPTPSPYIASGSGVINFQANYTNTGNTLNLVGSGTFAFSQRIDGGTVNRLQGSRMTGSGNATLNGVTLDFGAELDGTWLVQNGLTLPSNPTSNLRIGSDTSSPLFTGNVTFVGSQTLGGTGDVIFGASVSNTLGPQAGSTLTIGPGITVRGTAGTLGTASAPLVLQGAVRADHAGGTLTVTGTNWSNQGMLSAEGGNLTLQGAWTNPTGVPISADAGSTVTFSGPLTNTGTTLAVSGAGTFLLRANVTGGHVATQGGAHVLVSGITVTLAGVTLDGILDLGASGTANGVVNVTNGLTVNGAVNVGNPDPSSVRLGQLFFGTTSQTLGGTGTLVLGNSLNNFVGESGGSTATLTIGPGVTIRGKNGTVGTSTAGLLQQGTIQADVVGGTITVNGANWSNQGTLRAENGGILIANATLANLSGGTLTGGTWEAFANSIIRVPAAVTTNAATVLLDGVGSAFRLTNATTTDALANLAANAAGGSFTVQGGRNFTTAAAFSNAGSLIVGSASTFTTAGNYTQTAGSTTLNGGGLTATGGQVLLNGGLLAGTGTVTVTVTNAATVAPGHSPGTLTVTGNYTQTTAGSLNMEINGLAAGTDYDQLKVNGTVTLNGTLNLTVGFAPVVGSSFVLIDNNDVDAVTGAFNGLAEGSFLTLNGRPFQLTYQGGKGNDVVLTQLNTAPVPAPVGDRTVDEASTLTFTAAATDVDASQALTFSLDPGAPAGASIDPTTGVFTWTPTEAQGPGSFPVTVRVTDNGTPARSDAATITITVNEVNQAPSLAPIANATINEGTALSFLATATDPDLPANTLTFALDPGAPTGAGVDSTTGLFTWTPTAAQGAATYSLTLRVTDNGTPALGDAQTFLVTVKADQTITFDALPDLTYGAAAFALTATASSGLPVSFSVLAGPATVSGNTLSLSGAGTVTVRASQEGNDYYNPAAPVDQSFVVAPAPLTVHVDDQSRAYGDANPVFTGTVTGLQYADVITASYGTAATAASPVGAYAILAALDDPGGRLGNYVVTAAAGTLTVTPALLTVTADNATRVYGSANPTFTGTVTGIKNGDAIGAAFSTPATASSPAGTYAIVPAAVDAEPPRLSNYAVTLVPGTLTVLRATQTITWSDPVSVLDGTPLSGAQLNATVTVVGPAAAGALTYTPGFGAVLDVGLHTLTVTAAATEDYEAAVATVTLEVLKPASLSGFVFVDLNNDGEINFGEGGIAGVRVTLTGTDDLGQSVARVETTDGNGFYAFYQLRPGSYAVTETQPAGYLQGTDHVGTAGGTLAATDQFFVELAKGADGLNYNFGERPTASQPVQPGQTATIGFWNNKNGQALIRALNGGASSVRLGNWLATSFPNLYGGLAGKSNAEVAAYYQGRFRVQGQKLEAQVLATALAVYVTSENLAGTVAAAYGFRVSAEGVGSATFNVGSRGEAFGVADNTEVTVLDLLRATDRMSSGGVLYSDADPDRMKRLRDLANALYTDLNEAGNIG
jgi:MBG domain (YGX type)/SdrD B-like domain/Putative Ig domain